jgi:hypothetical protein
MTNLIQDHDRHTNTMYPLKPKQTNLIWQSEHLHALLVQNLSLQNAPKRGLNLTNFRNDLHVRIESCFELNLRDQNQFPCHVGQAAVQPLKLNEMSVFHNVVGRNWRIRCVQIAVSNDYDVNWMFP